MSDAARIAELESALSKERAYSLLLETTMDWKIDELVEQRLKEQKQSASALSNVPTEMIKHMVEKMEKDILAGVTDAVAAAMPDSLKTQMSPREYAGYARVKAQTYTDAVSMTERVSTVVTIPPVNVRLNSHIDPYSLR
jgi:hypothetical protein